MKKLIVLLEYFGFLFISDYIYEVFKIRIFVSKKIGSEEYGQ